jgi:ABC-2 type transport system permease protein
VRALVAQTRAELVLTMRRGESLLLVLGIPLLLLGFFAMVDVLPKGDFAESIDVLAPGVLALAVMSTAMVQLAIGTAFERQYGVLKRLGATPLGRPRLLGAKTLSIVAVEALQVVLLVSLALALGWDPSVQIEALGAVLLGTVAFAGLGLLMAGTLRGEVTLAAANGLYLVLLLLGGMVVPLTELPNAVRSVAELLPSAALADALIGSLDAGTSVPGKSWIVLGAWALVAPIAAARLFRWE